MHRKSGASDLVRESSCVEGCFMLGDSVLNQQMQHFLVGDLVHQQLSDDVGEVQ